MRYAPSPYRHAVAACDRIAGQILRAAQAMGLDARRDGSRVSASEYVIVELPSSDDDDGETLKVRVSDHADRYGGADYRVWCDERAAGVTGDGSWLDCVAWLSERSGRAVPPAVRSALSRRAAKEAARAAEAQAATARNAAAAAAAAEREAARRRWNPERWTAIASLPGHRGRERRRIYRRQADAALAALAPLSLRRGEETTDDYRA